MEFVVVIAVILVLLFILGIDIGILMFGVLCLLEIFLVFMSVFFTISLVMLLFSRKHSAEFLRIEKSERLGSHAWYLVDGKEYMNFYPADEILKKQLYRKKTTTIRLFKVKKNSIAFDRKSWVIIGIGFPVSWIFMLLMGAFLFVVMP